MAWPVVPPGSYPIGPPAGHILIRTAREGLAARVGHDLGIQVTRWSGTVTVPETGLRDAALSATIDLRSLTVTEGTGGVKPLTDSDRRDIQATMTKILATDRNPEARVAAGGLSGEDPDGSVDATLTLGQHTAPIRLAVALADGTLRAHTSVAQTALGITPYKGFLGALRLRDTVQIEAWFPVGDVFPG